MVSSEDTRIATAKTSFVQAVSEGIDALMSQCGYSRERATNTLVRELSRGDPPSARPDQDEIFDLMSQHGLGIEEATRLTIVGRALQRAMQSANSPSKAIQNLASKIAVTRLLYDSSEEEPASDDDVPIQHDFRVKPISPVERRTLQSIRGARLPSRSTPKRSRKRCMEDKVSAGESPQDGQSQRPRSESVSEEISAKIAQQHDETSIPSERKPPTTIRAKRGTHRDDNEGVLTPSNKRQRTSGNSDT